MRVRTPAVAGMFYPYNSKELRRMINSFLEGSRRNSIEGKLKGLVVPHAGYIYSGLVAAAGYRLLKENNPNVERVFLVGPSHTSRFFGVAQAEEEYWETPLGKTEVEQLPESQLIKNNSEVHQREHCLEVQVPFLQTVLGRFRIYALLTGELSTGVLANELAKEIEEDSVFIASSDLSHYHPYDQAVRIDSAANTSVPALDIEKTENFVEACGKDAVLTLMQIAKIKKWKGKFLDYRNSGDTRGPKDQVVGYGCYAFFE